MTAQKPSANSGIRIRPFLLLCIGILIFAKILLLSPSSIEQTIPLTSAVDPTRLLESLILDDSAPLAPGIPKNRIPENSVEKFSYVAVRDGQKQWKLHSDRAFLFNADSLVHTLSIHALLYDQDNKTTLVTGKEAKYSLKDKILEVFGDVQTTFPDGFVLYSQYLRYNPDRHYIDIPNSYHVRGISDPKNSQNFRFNSHGFLFAMNQSKITLPEAVTVSLVEPEQTTIEADQCIIERSKQLALFTMMPSRSLADRFVHIVQKNLFSRSRRAHLSYGNTNKVVHYLTAYDDVLLKETEDPPQEARNRSNPLKEPPQKQKEKVLRYATAGRADFDNESKQIILTRFPQVYQNEDTVTGERILLHRETDIVEVEQSNAFSEGRSERTL